MREGRDGSAFKFYPKSFEETVRRAPRASQFDGLHLKV
jgi:hypothetical protein